MSKINAVDHKVRVPVSSRFDASFVTIQVCFFVIRTVIALDNTIA